MYEIDIEREFSAAHRLEGYNGNCSVLHGHNWKVQVFVQAEKLDEIGIAVDFRKIKGTLDGILEEFDHSNLSDLGHFKNINPTSEKIAEIIYKRLVDEINDGNIKISRIRVCESPGSGATYYE